MATDGDPIANTLAKLAPYLSGQARGAIVTLCESRVVNKGDTFIEVGRRDRQEYILLSGLVRSFLLDSEGKEVTLSFFAGPAVLSPFLTRTVENRSILNFQALTLCHLAAMEASRSGSAIAIESSAA